VRQQSLRATPKAGKQIRRRVHRAGGASIREQKKSETAAMKSTMCRAGLVLVMALPAFALAASPTSKPKNEAPAKAVDLFAGMDAGDIEAVLIMKDSTEGNLTIKNNTDQPLTVKLPEAFAGVPILAQRRGGGGGGMAGGMGGMGGGRGGGMQGMMGGGMGGGMMGGGMGGGMGGMGGGMGGGMFNIAPDKVQKVKIAAVCMDHGLTDPNPRVAYKPIPAESYAKDASVIELVKLMLAGQIDQHSTQAAVWNLQNGLSWDELLAKIGAKHINGTTEPYFTAANIERALAAARVAKLRAEQLAKEKTGEKSLGEVLSAKQ
jgi:hypothetical protein